MVSTVLDYPLLLDALAFNNVQEGFELVASRFNGLTELIRRPDAGAALLNRYGAMDGRWSEGRLHSNTRRPATVDVPAGWINCDVGHFRVSAV